MEIKKTACNRDCPDVCGILATVEDGQITRITGDPDHPITQGFLCYRTNRFLKRQYAPERLTEPLLRNGSTFHPVSWDEALGRIADKMQQIRNESGPEAILHYRSGGSLGIMKNVSDLFFQRFGPVTTKSGDICSGAGDSAQATDFGALGSNDFFDLHNSKHIILWGKNPYISNIHLLPILQQAKARGAQLIQIDPVYHRGSELVDVYVQPRPGGDIALALGVAGLLFERDWIDPRAEQYCDNFAEFRQLCQSQSPQDWAIAADVEYAHIETIARAYANGPTATLVGWGMQRRAHGSAAVRVLDAVGTVSGNVGIAGGGVSFSFARQQPFDLSFLHNHVNAPRTIPETHLGPGILAAKDPPIRMVWVTAGNPVAMLPESLTVKQALESRELCVVVDSFMTDTTRCADIVLPTTTMLEEDDLLGSYGHHWLAEVRPVVDAPNEVKSDYQIVQALAKRVGLADEFSVSARTWKERLLASLADHGASLDALADGAVRNPAAAEVLFAGQKFATASGKANLITQAPSQPMRPPADFPLLLTALSTRKSQGSQWLSSEQEGLAVATVHPDAAPGFHDGDCARLESAIAAMDVRLRFDSRQRRDILLIDKGGWLSAGRCANALVPARSTDAGGGAAYYDTPVRILPRQ